MSKSYLSYKELSRLNSFEERFEYLKQGAIIGDETFGFDRYLNQGFYKSREWQQFRKKIIVRDEGCDLGIKDRKIGGRIIIHHINPISIADISEGADSLLDPNNVICVSHDTHNAIHYGDASLLTPSEPTERKPGDTKLW